MVTTSVLPHKSQDSRFLPTAIRWSVGTFTRLIGSAFPFHRWSVERLPPSVTPNIETAYHDFCERLLSAAKQCIPRDHRKNYVPCWNKQCETLHRSFIRAPVGTDSDRSTSSLLSRLQQKQERWEEAVTSIDFWNSSHKAWRTITKLTGRSGCSSRLCPVTTNSITLQFMKKEAHKTSCHESTRFVNKQLPDLWKIQTPNPLGRKSLLLPSDAWNQESLQDWIPSCWSSYSTPGQLSNLACATFLLPACTNSKLQRSGEER